MRLKKALLLCLVLSFTAATARERGITLMLNNWEKVSFVFSSNPEISIVDEELTMSCQDGTSVSYAYKEVNNFHFANIDNATGIQGTEDKSSAGPEFGFEAGVITATGLKAAERVSVYTVGGVKVGGAKASKDGSVRVDISSSPAGVYVVSAGSGISFKLLKK